MKWIIITGDSGKLGHEIVLRTLEDESYGVIGISRNVNEGITNLLQTYADRYVHLYYDLNSPAGVRDLYLNELKKIGPIFGLVNNSALAYDDIITNVDHTRLAEMYNVNVLSPIMLTKYVIRDMLLRKTKGSIIHISSVSAHTGYKSLSMYASTKGALEAFSKGTAREWGELGIRSNCVAPGFMETNMTTSMSTEQKTRIYNRTSLKQETQISSVAETVVFLLSNKAASITGEVIHVNCGTI
jgi:3-oxoacyl-[acyl-carrier protein] reductase